jgi:hypothetical protein
VLIHDTVYVPAPMATVDDAMHARGDELIREAVGAMAEAPTLRLVDDLVAGDSEAAGAWPVPTLGDPRRHVDRVLRPLVWTPSPANPFLWGFDGDLAYAPIGARLTLLSLSGTGDVVRLETSGNAIAERVAQYAVRSLLEHLAARIGAP